jgi:hypothetical protein
MTNRRFHIIDKMGALVATAESLSDARFAARKYDAQHIYDTKFHYYYPNF